MSSIADVKVWTSASLWRRHRRVANDIQWWNWWTMIWLAVLFVSLNIFAVSATALEIQRQTSPPLSYTDVDNCLGVWDDSFSISGMRQNSIGLQVTNRVTHQLISRVFAIFLRKVLKYRNVTIIPIKYEGYTPIYDLRYEVNKIAYAMDLIRYHPKYPETRMINLEVWQPLHKYVIEQIDDAGNSMTSGRFGWFVPQSSDARQSLNSVLSLHHSVFLNPQSELYQQYVIDSATLAILRRDVKNLTEYNSTRCAGRVCATLLAEYREDTAFVKRQIEESGYYLNVLWLGADLRKKILWLHTLYQNQFSSATYDGKNFVILHWTPSYLIFNDSLVGTNIRFQQMILPRCEESSALQPDCKYELTTVLKYHSRGLEDGNNKHLLYALRKLHFVDASLQELLSDYHQRKENAISNEPVEKIYDEVACNWLKNKESVYKEWISNEKEVNLYIGAIFPLSKSNRGHENLDKVAEIAVRAVSANKTVLTNYNFKFQKNDGQCKADVVMKNFIHYYNTLNVLGILGPACSETVEPIAGISKHTNMAVISYSAEGASFVDRKAYPYFFRTIGSNRQYEDVYISLLRNLNWQRVAALTEDGQKYTEYISHMEATMKQRGLELIMNKKFYSDITPLEMNKYLIDLKQRHAKIIIADIHNKNANLALCEAYKLGMTAYQGYVWFLPSWLSKNWTAMRELTNISCTIEEMQKAFNGHFSIMHTPFGNNKAIMQEGITIEQWMRREKAETLKNKTISVYAGFAYDAVWAYAFAADKLLRENPEAVNNLRTKSVVERFTQLIWETDFEGLSGRVRFGEGGSRITDIDIRQWQDTHFVEIGKFYPNVTGKGNNLRTAGGRLNLNRTLIQWLSDAQPPGDGTYDCRFSILAQLFSIDCDSAAVVFGATLCVVSVVLVSLVSFLFWKRIYDKKLKKSAKIMKTFGIDLLSPSRNKQNTLDKWEVPKENVVVNRRLGEGAFGTVYGGEALLNNDRWCAVAVKTLKTGASSEDRLDFLSEAEAMKRFDHKNIIKLVGVCLQSEPIYTIMEFMLYGDLKTYLLERRTMLNDKLSDDSDVSPRRLTMYAMDVARGLDYLAQQKYVHRDIACRNCLVSSKRVVKLGDFGMARPTFESDYYRFNRKGMLPVRWMAPESMELGMFTPASDVWAFGVVLYEIITFGSLPYWGLTNSEVLEYVKSGRTLQIPAGPKPQLTGLMNACWSQEVKKRPTAAEIIDYITGYPRLLTPCFDFPATSLEIGETDSNGMQLRSQSSTDIDNLDIVTQTNALNNFDGHREPISELELAEHGNLNITAPNNNNNSINNNSINTIPPANNRNANNFSPLTPDGYSIMAPLLMHQVSDNSSDSSQTRASLPQTTF